MENSFEIDEEVLRRAINKWGYPLQEGMVVEEMAELTHEIMKGRRGRETNIPEEIADVLIVVTQLALCQRKQVQEAISWKMERLKKRIED